MEQRKLDEAVAAFRVEIRVKPEYAEAHSNLGAAKRAHTRRCSERATPKLLDRVSHQGQRVQSR
jgi:hypothetical protein